MNFKNINLKFDLENTNKQKEKFYLLDIKYEEKKNRILTYFSKNPLSNNYDYVHQEVYHPYFIIDKEPINKKELLEIFKNKITIQKVNNNYKVIAKNQTILIQFRERIKLEVNCSKLINIEKQFLISKNWSYYDKFTKILNNKIQKIENSNSINEIIKKYLQNIDYWQKKELLPIISKNIIYSNLIFDNYNSKIDLSKEIINNICFKNSLFEYELLNNKNKLFKDIFSKINLKIKELEKSILLSKIINNNLELNKNNDYLQYNTELNIYNKTKEELRIKLELLRKVKTICNIPKINSYFPKLNLNI